MQKGTSAPIFKDISFNSSLLMSGLNISLIIFKTVAASVLPPANPAATGIFLVIFILTPESILYLSKNRSAALYAKFLLSLGIYSLSQSIIIPFFNFFLFLLSHINL